LALGFYPPTPVLAAQLEPVIYSTSTASLIIEAYAVKWGVDAELPKRIIYCESKSRADAVGKNYKNGKHWSSDHGPWQVNDYYHAKEAAKLGYDIYDWKGNLDYGFLLYTRDGTRHWLASRPCWQGSG